MLLSITLAALALPPQSPVPAPGTGLHRATPSKYLGTYHVASGTIARPSASDGFGSVDVIYDNSADSTYFASAFLAEGATLYDEGRVPGLTNPGEFTPGPNREDNRVTGFQFAYCDLSTTPQSSAWEIEFYSSYEPCTLPTSAPVATVTLAALPAGGCWTFDIDLSGSEFCLTADGGPVSPGFDNDSALDSFGWSVRYTGSGSGPAGPLLASNPAATDPGYTNLSGSFSPATPPSAGTGTYYGPPSLCADGSGSGLGTQDLYYVDGIPNAGCYFFGGYEIGTCGTTGPSPFASFHLVLDSDGGCPPPSFGTPFCSATPNSTGTAGALEALGSPVVADANVTLLASGLPNDEFGIFIHALDVAPNPIPSGAGVLCLDPLGSEGIGRFIQPGQVKSSGGEGSVSLSSPLGEWSVLAIPTSIGASAALAGQTSNFQFWHRDVGAMGQTYNLTEGVSVTWQ